jgi:hypothetical protein
MYNWKTETRQEVKFLNNDYTYIWQILTQLYLFIQFHRAHFIG